EVSRSGIRDVEWDADRSAAIRNPVLELPIRTGLVPPGEPLLDPVPVARDVQVVPGLELSHGGVDQLESAGIAHLAGREVRVGARSIPVAAHRLRVERRAHAEVFPDPEEEPAGDLEVVGHLEGGAGPDLELPLPGHDLGVDAVDLQAGRQAG